MDMIQATYTHWKHAQEQCFGTKKRLHDASQWGYHKIKRHAYGRKYEREAMDNIRNIVH